MPYPIKGSWSFKLKGPTKGKVSIRIQSANQLASAKFSRLGGRPGHQGYFSYDGPLKSGSMEAVVVEFYDSSILPVSVFLMSASGSKHSSGIRFLRDGQPTYRVMIPKIPFRILVKAKTKDGHEIQRIVDKLYLPEKN